MSNTHSDSLLDYYERELSYLRSAGSEFARQYPKVAASLELGEHESTDPHVERLLESFAFLTGRIQRQLDDAIPSVPAAMLDVLYPSLARPLPSCALIDVVIDPTAADLGEGYRIQRQTPVYVRNEHGQQCQFKTAYHLDLWPIEITEAEHLMVADVDGLDDDPSITSIIRLKLKTTGDGIEFDTLPIDHLRMHLAGERTLTFRLLETLLVHTSRIAVRRAGDQKPVDISAKLRLVGLEDDEALLPASVSAHAGYRLLQEYFAFADKHLFVDITELSSAFRGAELELFLCLDAGAAANFSLGPANFRLHTVPVVNLFELTSEPIRLDETQHEYRLVPDLRAHAATEIYSIEMVSCSSDKSDKFEVIAPFHSSDHTVLAEQPSCFWLSRRAKALDSKAGGTDIFLSFVDLNLDLDQPPSRSVYASTLCTNRHAASQIASGAQAEIERDAPISGIRFLSKPTTQVDPPISGQTMWRLISHLSLNHLSLSNSKDGLRALREILRLYAFIDPAAADQQLAGLRKLENREVSLRIGDRVWRGFCFGTRLDLTLDPKCFVGSSALVLGYVLDRFLALYTACNSFTQLNVKRIDKQGIWHAWPPRSGDQPLV